MTSANLVDYFHNLEVTSYTGKVIINMHQGGISRNIQTVTKYRMLG